MDPFAIFPKEIWEMVIDRLENNQEILNLLKTSKKLEEHFQPKKHNFLLEKVLPCLVSQKHLLDVRDLLCLRRVNKRWSASVDLYLETQPSLRICTPNDPNLADKLRHDLNHANENFYPDHFGGVRFDKSVHPNLFSLSTLNTPEQRNPFISRMVTIAIPKFGNEDEELEDELVEDFDVLEKIVEYVNQVCSKILKPFGRHIWYLAFEWHMETREATKAFWKSLVRILSFTPNLKWLRIGGIQLSDIVSKENEMKELLKNSEKYRLPDLPQLESLQLRLYKWLPDLLRRELLNKYANQLRMIDVGLSPAMKSIPKLSDLFIKTPSVLGMMKASMLTKLKIMHSSGIGERKLEQHLFRWLKQIPTLQYLDSGASYIEEGTLLVEKDSLPSLKYLRIRDGGELTYDFVKCLPNLERLNVCLNADKVPSPEEIQGWENAEALTPYESNIWVKLPKLKTLRMHACSMCVGGLLYCRYKFMEFDRERFEKTRREETEYLVGFAEVRNGMMPKFYMEPGRIDENRERVIRQGEEIQIGMNIDEAFEDDIMQE